MTRRIVMLLVAALLTLGMVAGPALAKGPGQGARTVNPEARTAIGDGTNLFCSRGNFDSTVVPHGAHFRMTGPDGHTGPVRLGTEANSNLMCRTHPLGPDSLFIYFRVPPGQLTWVAPTRRELYERIFPS